MTFWSISQLAFTAPVVGQSSFLLSSVQSVHKSGLEAVFGFGASYGFHRPNTRPFIDLFLASLLRLTKFSFELLGLVFGDEVESGGTWGSKANLEVPGWDVLNGALKPG
jgi:hypothetical protein